jgi:hypothetical protein
MVTTSSAIRMTESTTFEATVTSTGFLTTTTCNSRNATRESVWTAVSETDGWRVIGGAGMGSPVHTPNTTNVTLSNDLGIVRANLGTTVLRDKRYDFLTSRYPYDPVLDGHYDYVDVFQTYCGANNSTLTFSES